MGKGQDEERPFLRILAPKFICNNKSNQTNDNVTIGLQTKGGQKLKYKVNVGFELSEGFKSQSHSISIWKNVALLQKKFDSMSDEISIKNLIEINSKEVNDEFIMNVYLIKVFSANSTSNLFFQHNWL